ncbi:MAG: hypothetical protein JWL70_1471, partial [Acidimicrobiia bacterium]|nr:hypothetical protein [Acidimicrobiia bacterium]
IAAPIALIVGPTAIQYLRAQNLAGQSTPALIPDSSFRPVDLLAPKPNGLVSKAFDGLGASQYKWERTFFLGITTLALAVIGLVVLWRVRSMVMRRLECVLVLAAGAVGAVLALGPEVAGVTGPLKVFAKVAPGLDSIRAPARLAAPLLLSLALCAAIGLAWLADQLRGRRALALHGAVAALVLVELANPIRRVPLPNTPADRAVYQALAKTPNGPTVELPMVDLRTDGTEWAFVEAPRMVLATIDWHPRVNGYSGGSAPEYLQHIDRLNRLPDPAGLAELATLHVRYLILHVGQFNGYPMYTPEQARQLVTSLTATATVTATQVGADWLVDLGSTS